MHVCEHQWSREDSTVTIEIVYSWSRPRPATYLDPPEGGVSVDCITATAIVWDEEPSRKATAEELDAAGIAFPSDKAYFLCVEDHADRDDSARESAAEARAERMAELKMERGY